LLNALSVDVEDYFQVEAFSSRVDFEDWNGFPPRVEDNTYRLLEILGEFGVKATFFCLGWVAERHPKLISRIAQEGHEVASHGYAHQPVYRQSRRAFRADIRRAKEILEGIVGRPVVGYRAPTFSITEDTLWALEVIAEEGYSYDSSIFPIRHDLYGFPEAPRFPFMVKERYPFLDCGSLMEFPMSTFSFFGINLPMTGGGYFRFLPYALLKWAFRVSNARGEPFIFYLHPWELDPSQPRINGVPWRSRLRHYFNLRRAEAKLRRLLGDFRFTTVREVLGL